MIIGSCIIKIKIFFSNSLKDKRRIVKSIISKLKSRYNISIAEVGDNEKWNVSEIGFSCVSNSSSLANETIDKIIAFIDNNGDVEILNIEREII